MQCAPKKGVHLRRVCTPYELMSVLNVVIIKTKYCT